MTALRILTTLPLFLAMISGRAHAFDGQDKTFILGGAYVPAQEGYNLEGTGFEASAGPDQGTGIAALIRMNRTESSLAFEYLQLETDHNAASGMSPSKVTSEFTRYLVNYRPLGGEPFAGVEGLMLEYGLELRQRSAQQTSPNIFIPSRDSIGVRFGLARDISVGSSTYLETGFGLFIPLYFDEGSTKTGSYKFSVNPDLKLTLVHNLTDVITIAAGASLIHERIYYSGTGARGTKGGFESFTNIQLPFELRFRF